MNKSIIDNHKNINIYYFRHRESLFSVILYGTYGIIGIGYWEVLPIFVASQKKFGKILLCSLLLNRIVSQQNFRYYY